MILMVFGESIVTLIYRAIVILVFRTIPNVRNTTVFNQIDIDFTY